LLKLRGYVYLGKVRMRIREKFFPMLCEL